MLIKLNQGEKLIPKDLAKEFRINLRTFQRDLNIRFAGLAGVKGLFPSLSDEFLGELFDARIDSNMLV